MPRRGEPLRKLGFLTIGRFDAGDPAPGIEETLQTIERAEALGFDSVWLRDRHLQPGISSPVAIMAAASQRTRRIELGTAVIPLGLENPFRLAEDLATVDILSGGRINPGVSVGTPMMYDHYKTALYPETHDSAGLLEGAGAAAAQASAGRARQRLRRHRRNRAIHRPRPAAFTGARRPRLVRRRPGVGGLGWQPGHQLSDQLRREHRRRRVAGLRHHPGPADRRLPGAPPASREGARVTGSGRDPHRFGHR